MLNNDDIFNFRMPEIKPYFQAEAESFPEAVREVIQQLQAEVGPGQELQVYYSNGIESIRVGHISTFKTSMAVIAEGKEKTRIGFSLK